MTDAVSLASLADMRASQGNAHPARQAYPTRSRLVKMGHHSLTRREGEDD
jgi:hypothetical protein